MIAKNFVDVFKKLEKATATSKKQAYVKALNTTKTKYASMIAEELGIPVSLAKKRAKIFKGDNTYLSIGVRVGLAAQDLKPGRQKVDSTKGIRYAATYKLRGVKNVLSNGAFLASVNTSDATKKLVLQRVGGNRYPTKTTVVDVFRPQVEAMVPDLNNYLYQSFDRIFRSQLEFNLSD